MTRTTRRVGLAAALALGGFMFFGLIGKAAELEAGAKLPAVTVPDQDGQPVDLAAAGGSGWTLVYFYPKADTPGCTTQACGLRDVLGDIGDTAVLGISPDKPDKQKRFDDKYGLGFPLLSDQDHAVADAYGAWGERSMYGRKFMGVVRSAVLVDAKGKVSHVWPKISPKDTPVELLAALDELA